VSQCQQLCGRNKVLQVQECISGTLLPHCWWAFRPLGPHEAGHRGREQHQHLLTVVRILPYVWFCLKVVWLIEACTLTVQLNAKSFGSSVPLPPFMPDAVCTDLPIYAGLGSALSYVRLNILWLCCLHTVQLMFLCSVAWVNDQLQKSSKTNTFCWVCHFYVFENKTSPCIQQEFLISCRMQIAICLLLVSVLNALLLVSFFIVFKEYSYNRVS